jgi:hypothetical protein
MTEKISDFLRHFFYVFYLASVFGRLITINYSIGIKFLMFLLFAYSSNSL